MMKKKVKKMSPKTFREIAELALLNYRQEKAKFVEAEVVETR